MGNLFWVLFLGILLANQANAAQPHHPRRWRFTMPKGDPAAGRAVFEKFECYYCHEVRGEKFPDPTDSGPELSQMGPLHPLEFFTESIINPSAVAANRDRGKNGKSLMSVDHLNKMTLQEVIDLSNYLASLKPPVMPRSVSGTGKVIAVVRQSNEVILEHGYLKDFMEPMTMGYKVAGPAQLRGLAEGDNVEFTIDTAKRVITRIVKTKK